MSIKYVDMIPGDTLTGADEFSYLAPAMEWDWMSVPNDRIGTRLLAGESGRRKCGVVEWGGETKYIIEDDDEPKPKALTNDTDKPPLATLPWKALREVAMVQAYGAQKYAPYNWKKGLEITRNASCAIRHIADYLDGRDIDDESKRHALAHAACRVLFMLENVLEGTATDDRFKRE